MKNFKIPFKQLLIPALTGLMVTQSACKKDLLNQVPTTELAASQFWTTEADATSALMGAYASIRPLFDRDYYYEGQGEYVRVRSATLSTSDNNLQYGYAYRDGDYNPSGYGDGFDRMYRFLYGGINRTNYVIENVSNMLPKASADSRASLETIIGEARLLRGLVYFRLISMWGDVPYFNKVIAENSEVANIARTPIGQVKDSILADLTYAAEKLPDPSSSPQLGRASKAAALALRGKVQLYWASWNNFGWPELEGFQPSSGEAATAYTAAAEDFKKVINNFGLTLYMNGAPGEIDEIGWAGKLPNYYHLFTPKANGNPENLFVFTHGGQMTNQSEVLMRDFAGRSHEFGQCWVHPRYEIADRYQLRTTGDFATKLRPMNPTTNSTARTTTNSAVNPQSYANRDYRMKATIMWDYEMSMGMFNLKETGWVPFIYKTSGVSVQYPLDGKNYISYETTGTNSGYVFRKFVRNYAGQGREEGDLAWPVIRLADVYLMYAEATNEVVGPQADAIEFVNMVRRRGNLPNLAGDKVAGKAAFFAAIEQERIVELIGEGQRPFDLRRWRAIEKVWGPAGSAGLWRIDTWGANQQRYYQNTSDRTYQQNYIFRIPQSERDRNPNLTQNLPWR